MVTDTFCVLTSVITIISTCFRRQFRPSSEELDCVYSLWYNALAMLPAGDQDEVEFHLILVTSKQHRQCVIPQAVNIV